MDRDAQEQVKAEIARRIEQADTAPQEVTVQESRDGLVIAEVVFPGDRPNEQGVFRINDLLQQ